MFTPALVRSPSLRAQGVGDFSVQVPSHVHQLPAECLEWMLGARGGLADRKPGLKTGRRPSSTAGPQSSNVATGQSGPWVIRLALDTHCYYHHGGETPPPPTHTSLLHSFESKAGGSVC